MLLVAKFDFTLKLTRYIPDFFSFHVDPVDARSHFVLIESTQSETPFQLSQQNELQVNWVMTEYQNYEYLREL
jgi:hypothetical protein